MMTPAKQSPVESNDEGGRTSLGKLHWLAWGVACVVVAVLVHDQFGAQVTPAEQSSGKTKSSAMVSLPNLGWPEFSSTAAAPVRQRSAIDHGREFQLRRDLAEYYEENRRSTDVIARYTAIAAALECGSERLQSKDVAPDDRRQAAVRELLARCGKLARLPLSQLTEDLREAATAAGSDALGARLVRQLQAPESGDGDSRRQLIAAVVATGDAYLLQLAEPMLYEYWNRLRGSSDQMGSRGTDDPVLAGFRLALCDSGLPCGSDSFDVLRSCVLGACGDSVADLTRRRLGDDQLPHAEAWRRRFAEAIHNRDGARLGLP
ncbi:MAG: hypothetical protein ACK56N_08120 [Betaproteobacteria bacterium]|jgi:hypothetical protein